jgi:hypothetical protein
VSTADDDRRAILVAAAAALGPRMADRAPDIRPFPVPGLGERAVWRVRLEDLDHPVQVYVGLWPDGRARLLSDDQPAFLDLAGARGAEIDDADTALGYVLGFLEATRGPSVIVRPVSEPGDIPWRPGSPDEEARRAEFASGPGVAPPRVEETPEGFDVELWLVVDQRIQRNIFRVSGDGSVSAEHHVVAADLPLPIAR